MENQLVLGYWSIRGLAERIRQLLEYCGLPYTEEKYEGEADRHRWNNEVKPQLILKNPAITLPYLRDGDKIISESDAINVYVCFKANKPELTGRNVDEKVALATAWGVYKDTHIQFVGLCYGHHGHPTFEAAVENFPNQIRPYLAKLNGLLGSNSFIAG
jgi:glutathione S-transferase